jgi:hypothetical protein
MQRLRAVDPSIDLRTYDESRGQTGDESFVKLLRHELIDLRNALAVARTQLRWVEDLTPRRLPIPVQADEVGLGVVRGVRLNEPGESPGADGSRPWVTVDWGNAYVTDRRLVFCGVSDVEFGFAEIQRKGASRTGLLLGVSSREGAHLLEGPGERLAVVLTAAEKIAIGLDPTMPFNETIERLTAEIDTVSRRLEAEIESASEGSHGLDLPAHSA